MTSTGGAFRAPGVVSGRLRVLDVLSSTSAGLAFLDLASHPISVDFYFNFCLFAIQGTFGCPALFTWQFASLLRQEGNSLRFCRVREQVASLLL